MIPPDNSGKEAGLWMGPLSTSSEQVIETGSGLPKKEEKGQSLGHCLLLLLSCKMWSVLHANEWQETGNEA